MKVSICVPVYGVEKYIARCAKSLFQQTYRNIEYIFVNDKTKDNSIQVLKDIIHHYPIREKDVIILNHEHNKGLAAARNTALNMASGDFIMWVDADDYVDHSIVEKLIQIQSVNNSDIVCCDAKVLFFNRTEYYKNTDYMDGKDYVMKMFKNDAPHQVWGRIIRKSLYIENNIIAVEGVNQAEDWQVMPRLAYYANKVSTLHEALYFYDRTFENSYSNNFDVNKSKQISFAEGILKSFFIDKESNLYEYLEFSIAKSLVWRIKRLSLLESEANEHYKELVDELQQINPYIKKQLRFDLYVISMLRNKRIVSYITKLSNILYETFSFLKNK